MKILVKNPLDMMEEDDEDDPSEIANFSKGGSRNGSEKVVENPDNREENHSKVGSRGTNRGGEVGTSVGIESKSKRRGSSATSERKYSRGKNSSAESGKVDQNNISDDETDEDYAENELTLTNIASGQMLTGGICTTG